MAYYSHSSRNSGSRRGTGGRPDQYSFLSPTSSATFGSSNATPKFIKQDLGALIQTFERPSSDVDSAKITGVKPIASYSWIEAGSRPTILVPGSPPVWKNANPSRVPQDRGLVYVDQNSYRVGSKTSPLTPIFASIEEAGSEVDLDSLDIVTDRNNLRKLLRWATGATEEKDFRIDVELAGRTCIFTRREEKDSEYVTEFRGFGHEYEKAATRWPKGSERATGHHRIVSINLGGIKVLLRFEVDACTKAPPATAPSDIDDLTVALAGLSTGTSASAPKKNSFSKTLDIRRSNNTDLAPQSTLIELKTRAAHKLLDMDETAPQLYLSQTPYLYLAKHVRGEFQTVEVIRPNTTRVEQQVGKLRKVLLDIIDAVRKEGYGKELCLIGASRKVELYNRRPGTGRQVGPEILSKFTLNNADKEEEVYEYGHDDGYDDGYE